VPCEHGPVARSTQKPSTSRRPIRPSLPPVAAATTASGEPDNPQPVTAIDTGRARKLSLHSLLCDDQWPITPGWHETMVEAAGDRAAKLLHLIEDQRIDLDSRLRAKSPLDGARLCSSTA
jgi:hypothetical protein